MKIGVNPCLQFYKGKLGKEEELRLLCMYSIIYKMTDEETVAFGMMTSKGAGKELSFTFTLDEIRECRATLLSEHKNLKCTFIRELSEYDKDMCYLCPYHTSYKNYRYKKERKYLCLIVTSKVPIGNNLKTLLSKTGGKRKLDTFFSSYTYLDISGERVCIPLYSYIAEFYISQPLLVGSMEKKEVGKQLLSYLVGKITENRLTLDVTELETLLKKEINTVHACDVKHITADEMALLYDELIKPVTYSSTDEYKSLIVELKGLPKLSGAWIDGKQIKNAKQDTTIVNTDSKAEDIGNLPDTDKQTESGAADSEDMTAATPSVLSDASSSETVITTSPAQADSDKRVEDALAMMMAFMNTAAEDGVQTSTLSDLIGDVEEPVKELPKESVDETPAEPAEQTKQMECETSVSDETAAEGLKEESEETTNAGMSDEEFLKDISELPSENQEKVLRQRQQLEPLSGLDKDLVAFAPEDFIKSLAENGYKEHFSMFDTAPALLLGDEDVLSEEDMAKGEYERTFVASEQGEVSADDKETLSVESEIALQNASSKGEFYESSSFSINSLLSFSMAAGVEDTAEDEEKTDVMEESSCNNSEFDEISDFNALDDKDKAKPKKTSKKGKNGLLNDAETENIVDNNKDYSKNETFYPRNHKIRFNAKEMTRYSVEDFLLFNKLLEKATIVSMEAVTMVFDKGEESYGLLIYLEKQFFFMEPDKVPLRALQRLLHSDALIITLHSAELYQILTKHKIDVHYLRIQDLLYMYVSLHQAKCLEDDNLHLATVFKEMSKERITPSGRFYLKAMPLYGKVFEDIDTYVVQDKYKTYDSYLRMSYYCSFSLDTSDFLTEKAMYQRCGLYAIKSVLKKDVHPTVPGTCYYFTVFGDSLQDKAKRKEYYRKALWKLQDGKSFYLGKVRILYLGERGLFLFARETNNMTYEMLQYAFIHAARIMDLQEVPKIKMVKEIYEYEE